jgi:hypothetical protein
MLAQGTIFLNFIRHVVGSNVGGGTDYPEKGSAWFSAVSPGKYDATNGAFHIVLSTYHSSLCSLRY